MSRVAKQPIELTSGVEVKIDGQNVAIKGSKGQQHYIVNDLVKIIKEENILRFEPKNDSMEANAQAGTARANINNVVVGVTKGFEKKLIITGVGYRAQVQGNKLNLTLGFSHPVIYQAPDGITIETPTQTEVVIKGTDKQLVGQVAANIRAYRPPNAYKGKGIRYADEQIILKETKKK